MVAAARLRHLGAHLRTAAPAAAAGDSAAAEPMRAGGENGIPFEQWEVGQRFYTTRRTISDGDISTYVQVAGFQAENLFADMEYLRSQGHPARMAPGMLTASIADALIVGSGIIEGYAVAMIGIDGLMAKKGVYAGDTISVEFEVTSVVPSRSNPTRGVVGTDVSVVNQDGDVVLVYHVKRMLKRSDAAAP